MVERKTAITLPLGSIGHVTNGWWAMLFIILTEGALFAYLLFAYYYLAIQPNMAFPPSGTMSLHLALPNTFVLLASSGAVWWGERAIKQNRTGQLVAGLGIAFVLGAVFVGVQVLEWANKPFTFATSAYSSLYFTVTGFHMAHVAAGLIMLGALFVWALLGYFDRVRNAPVAIGAIYWHFVDAVWIAVFLTFYITPYLGLGHG